MFSANQGVKLRRMFNANTIGWILASILVGVVGYLCYRFWFVNPLPSDESMIEHFNKHRAEIEELVQSYRTYKNEGRYVTRWEHLLATQELMQKADIWRLSGDGAYWLEDPYSIDVAKSFELKAMIGIDAKTYNPIIDKTIKGIIVVMKEDKYTALSLRFGPSISKEYIYYPVVPKIQNGFLLYPIEPNGTEGKKIKVLPSLTNYYPSDWKRGECFLRKIESQWFIKMCRGY